MKLPNPKLKTYNLKILILVLGAFSILSFTFAKANAQLGSPQTFTVTPPTASVTLDAGGHSEGTMGVINDSDVAMTFTLYVLPPWLMKL